MGVRTNLVGGQSLVISGDKVKMVVDVATNMGIKTLVQEFLILENDVMGAQWHTSLVDAHYDMVNRSKTWPSSFSTL